jgi:hypothetical protein
MLDGPVRSNAEVLDANDLAILRATFDVLCQEFAITPQSEGACCVARELIRLFQAGMTESAMLLIAVRNRWHVDWKMVG